MPRFAPHAMVLVVFVLCAGCTTSSTPSDGDGTAVSRTIDSLTTQFASHMRAGHMDSVAALYTENAVLMPPNSPTATGRAAIRDALSGMVQGATLDDFRLTTTDVRVSGDLARERGRYSMSMTAPGQGTMADSGKYVVVWQRQSDGSWLVDSDIWNSDISAAPTAPAPDSGKTGG